MSRIKYTKQTALEKIVAMGEMFKQQSAAGYWSAEDNARKIPEAQKNLVAARKIYKAVRDYDAKTALPILRTELNTIGGIEGNFIRLVALDLYGVDVYALGAR